MLDGLCATIMARSVLESEWDCFVSINSVRLSHERNSQRCDLGDRERECLWKRTKRKTSPSLRTTRWKNCWKKFWMKTNGMKQCAFKAPFRQTIFHFGRRRAAFVWQCIWCLRFHFVFSLDFLLYLDQFISQPLPFLRLNLWFFYSPSFFLSILFFSILRPCIHLFSMYPSPNQIDGLSFWSISHIARSV